MPTSLSNCYIPLPHVDASDCSSDSTKDLTNRSSGDGGKSTRSAKALRRLVLQRSILSSSSGSALVELGNTKVLCAVHGPRPIISAMDQGTTSGNGNGLHCQVRHAPSFGVHPETKVLNKATALGGSVMPIRSNVHTVSDEEIELSARLLDAMSPSLPLFLFSSCKCVVDVFCMVLQGDGSTLAACITAASLALADSGIEMYDLVSCCSVAVMRIPCPSSTKTVLFLDPSEEEIQRSQGVVTVALMKNWKEINLWNQVGRIPPDVSNEALDLCKDGCVTMHKFMRQALMNPSPSQEIK
jgi:exosome complex component MTR3